MNQLKNHLLLRGISDVRLFFWSGKANLTDIDKAGANLSNDLERWFTRENAESGKSLRVFAKSSGGLVFRSALRHLADRSISLASDVLLQVAVPNPVVTERTICSVKKVVNLYSESDWVLRLTFTLGPYKRYAKVLAKVDGATKCNDLRNVEIPTLGHKDFNWNTLIRTGSWAGKNLYDIYYEILAD